MEYLQIRNWDKWQTYRKDRSQPPWIKVHRRIMRNPKWVGLSDAERGQLISIWLLGADRDGKIPDDPDLIKKLCFMQKKPNLNKFIGLRFIDQSDAKLTPERRQHDAPEKSRVEKKREDKSIGKMTPPSLEDVKKYFQENGYSEETAKNAFHYYQEGDWKDSRGQQVRSWKQKMRGVWFKPENKGKVTKSRIIDTFKNDQFLITANKYITQHGYNEDDFNKHCRSFNKDPGEVREKIRQLTSGIDTKS